MMKSTKICHLTTAHPSWDIRIFHKECISLAKAGYETILIVQDAEDNIRDGVQIKALPKAKNRLMRMVYLPWYAFCVVLGMRPKICHFHDPELIPAGIMMKLAGIKVVYDVHEDYPHSLLASDRAWLPNWSRNLISLGVAIFERLGVKVFDGISVATPAIGKRFPTQKTATIQNFPILDELDAKEKIRYRERSSNIIYTGAVSFLRGIQELMQAIDYLIPNYSCKLLLAGKFDSPEMENEIRQMSSWQHVDYRGWISRESVEDLLGQAKVGVVNFHPVFNHMEAQPNKLFEYMSAGIPVVASDFPLWRKIIGDAECGLLVDPLDPIKIAEAIRWLLDHPVEAEAMGKRGKKAVEERYNWNIEEKKLLAFYERILA